VPSTVSGFVTEILVPEGETVDVGAKLAVIGDAPPAIGSGAAAESAADSEPPASAAEPVPAQAAEPAEPSPSPAAQPVAAAPAPVHETVGSPNAPAVAPSTVPAAQAGAPVAAEAPPAAPAAAKLLLSPLVRKLVTQHQLDVTEIPGTGRGGRITRGDVLAFVDRNGGRRPSSPSPAIAAPPASAPSAPALSVPAPAPAPARPAPARPSPAPTTFAAGADDVTVKFSNIRRRTAEHMVRSLDTSAHVLTVTDVDFYGVDSVRLAVREEFKAREGFSLTYLPFVARAVVDALGEFPHLNASVGDNELVLHRRINLGFAVDLNFEGLIVPVIKDADTKRLRAIAESLADLAARARSRELTADDISGGTFTITNPGPFGTFITAPIINQPQVAILSTDGVRKRPVAVELPDGSDAVVVHPVGNLGLSFDHRAVDGAYASAFLGRCRQILETRDWSQEV
jgi:2-oxoglutarate dehydrogenase E2 component (dihydrolipoamide succinyltransferase)